MTELFPPESVASLPGVLQRDRRHLLDLENEYIALGAGPENKERRDDLIAAMIAYEALVARLEREALK